MWILSSGDGGRTRVEGKCRPLCSELCPARRLELQRQSNHVPIECDSAVHVADENNCVADSHFEPPPRKHAFRVQH
jgi:hypothetical protein